MYNKSEKYTKIYKTWLTESSSKNGKVQVNDATFCFKISNFIRQDTSELESIAKPSECLWRFLAAFQICLGLLRQLITLFKIKIYCIWLKNGWHVENSSQESLHKILDKCTPHLSCTQCSPYQAVTGKIYCLKQNFLPPTTTWRFSKNRLF